MKVRAILTLLAIFAAALASAGTLVVTSPTAGAFLGTSNQVKFQITGAVVEVRVKVKIDGGPGGVVFDNQLGQAFTPDSEGKITGEIPVNFGQSTPDGTYTLTVSATEPNNTYTPVSLNVNIDVTKPKFFDFNPVANSFVKGPTVPIIVKVVDTNFKEYRVQVNSQDIPNNTGTTLDPDGSFTVNWNVTGILQDGPQTITITVKDQADNQETKTLAVTIDRVPPTTQIVYPLSSTRVRPRSTVSVIVDVQDQSSSSMHITGVDVIITNMNNQFLMRVPRVSFQASGSTKVRWSGRIRSDVTLPSQFKIVTTAIDRAGNVGQPQTTVVTVG